MGGWSELPQDLLRSIFERLSLADFCRAKLVCRNYFSVSKLTVPRKSKSPWLMIFPKGENSTCMLYNPEEENRIYTSKRDFSEIRFLASYANWSLVLDSKSNLHIIDLFSENMINLPPLESLQPCNRTIKRLGDKIFESSVTRDDCTTVFSLETDVMRGRLWVDAETKEKGDDRYTNIPLLFDEYSCLLQAVYDVVLLGHSLYIQSNRDYIRHVDLSGKEGFKEVSWSNPLARPTPYRHLFDCMITTVTRSGEVLMVESFVDRANIERDRSFRVFKTNHSRKQREYYTELHSLGDEGFLLGLRTTVPGIEPNSIYFTSHDSVCHRILSFKLDICKFNLATKTFTRFPRIENMNLKAARWFLPDTC